MSRVVVLSVCEKLKYRSIPMLDVRMAGLLCTLMQKYNFTSSCGVPSWDLFDDEPEKYIFSYNVQSKEK